MAPPDLLATVTVMVGDEPITKRITTFHSHMPLPIEETPSPLDGLVFAKFTVIGKLLSEYSHPNRGASYVVRCQCGSYEIRKAKAIRNPANVNDCCAECRTVRYLRHKLKWEEESSGGAEGDDASPGGD
jgi:hypothetical protein